MSRFTVYVDRDIPVECKNDAAAAQLARRIHEAVDHAIEQQAPGAVCSYARSACQRGTHNKYVFDAERMHNPDE